MDFSYKYAHAARDICAEIEAELTHDGIESLARSAATMGFEQWQAQLDAMRNPALVLVAEPVSRWKKHPMWKDAAQRSLLLCAMYVCARQGAKLLHMLAQYGHRLLPGGSYRDTAACAAEFAELLLDELPDAYWPFEQFPTPFPE